MKKIKLYIQKLIKWFKESNRYKHFLGGIFVALFATTCMDGIMNAIIAAWCLEYKDFKYGSKFDITDFLLTILGGAIIRLLILCFM